MLLKHLIHIEKLPSELFSKFICSLAKYEGFHFPFVCASMSLLKETISSFDFYFDQFVREK